MRDEKTIYTNTVREGNTFRLYIDGKKLRDTEGGLVRSHNSKNETIMQPSKFS